jgi:hypothetical protein
MWIQPGETWNTLPTAIKTLLTVLTFLGIGEFFIEPGLVSKELRKKYARCSKHLSNWF